jgi:hypothetical protein
MYTYKIALKELKLIILGLETAIFYGNDKVQSLKPEEEVEVVSEDSK